MNTIIGLSAEFLTDTRLEKIKKAAQQYGYSVKVIKPELHGSDLADCSILFGVVPFEQLKFAEKLIWFHTSMAGVDKITNPAMYASPNVILTNSAGAYGVSIAEHLLGMLLILLRGLDECVLNQTKHVWGEKRAVRSIYGSRITVVGLGDIGSNFAKRVHALGAHVIGVRKTPHACPDYLEALYTSDKLDEALSEADIIALSVPATAETGCLMSAKRLANLKQGAVILNVGRGNAVDQDALCRELNSGHLGGAGLDVTVPEPLPADNPLWQAKNCLITPHISGNWTLPHTCERILEIFLENLKAYAEGKTFLKTVDRNKGY